MPASARTPSDDAVNWPARLPARNRKPAARSPGSISRLRICCTVQGRSGFAVIPGMWTWRLPISMTNRQYRRCRVTAQSTGEKPAASIVAAWVRGNCRQAVSVCRSGAGGDLQGLEVTADGRCADPVAGFQQLALDPLVSPAGIFGSEPLDERGDLGTGRRPSPPLRAGPRAADQAAVPAQDGAGHDQPAPPRPCRQKPDQRGEDRAAGP